MCTGQSLQVDEESGSAGTASVVARDGIRSAEAIAFYYSTVVALRGGRQVSPTGLPADIA